MINKQNFIKGLVCMLMSLPLMPVQAQTIQTLERGNLLELNAPTGYYSYQWQVSSDSKNFVDIPDAIQQKLSRKVYAPGYYRVKVNQTTNLETTQITLQNVNYAPGYTVSGGGHGYIESLDRQPGASGIQLPEDREGAIAGTTKVLTNWTNGKAMAVYYFNHPASIIDTKMQLKIQANSNVSFRVKVFDPTDLNNALAENIVALQGTGEAQTIPLIGFNAPKNNIYYRYQLECLNGWENIIEISKFHHYSTSNAKTYKPGYLSSPSVRLNNWRSDNPKAPEGKAYDWCYMEVMMPKESDIPGTYIMSLGVLDGYMGIQMNGYENGKPRHDVIFSMWDHGSVDEDPNLPDNLRANVIDYGPGVQPERFANEGTGMKTFKKGYNWECGTFVQFITNCRPEDATYTVIENGKEVVKHQKNTLCSAWYNAQDGKGWQYMATLRMANKQINFDSWYSFLENYNWSTGQALRKGYYRNGYGHAKDTKKWYHFNQVNFSNTDGSGKVGSRDDFGQGACDEYANTFFMTTGGFIPKKVTDNRVNVNATNTPVETINLNQLLERVDLAVANEKAKIEAKENFKKNKIDKTGWSVIEFSSEEAEGEDNGKLGHAAQIIDNDYTTYWTPKWKGGNAEYPHTLVVDMKTEHNINGVQITSSNGNNAVRTLKDYDCFLSKDNKTWEKVHSETSAPNELVQQFMLDKTTKARYFKLVINKSHAYEGPFVRVNEIELTEDPNPSVLLGDVNDDGTIDVTDITGVVNIILGNTAQGLNQQAADVNNDGTIDVTDITAIVNLILGNTITSR